jgi:hypothetical protein
MSDVKQLHRALVARVLDGVGSAPAVRAAGLSEDQIFEIALCAAIGQATRQYESALAALDAATERRG